MDREAMTMGLGALTGLSTALAVGSTLAIGTFGGAVYYYTLWHTVQLITSSGVTFKAVALQLARFMLIAMMLAMVVHFGWVALLTATLGILASRFIALHSCGVHR
jgi:hypothetical protein